jgi:4-hydroxybenzoate polyprenyltransferase
MWQYFQIVRILNLFFIILIQWMIKQFVLVPLLLTNNLAPTDTYIYHFLLIIATVLIAAGGYVLNDYFDMKIDAINRPEKQYVGKSVSKQTAMLMHQVLTFCGVVTGLLLAWFLKNFTLALIFIVIPGLLWFYSASYKRQLIIGNVIIAFIAALSIFVVGMTEMAVLQKKFGYLIFETEIPFQIYAWTGGFAVFAFLLTWIREIIKDMEDIHGDRELECRTMPIVWGITKTKIALWSLIIFTSALLLSTNFFLIPFKGTFTLRYIIVGIIIPLAMLSYLIYKASKPADYHQAATLSKFIMFIGVLYTLVFNYLLAKASGISIFNTFIIQ